MLRRFAIGTLLLLSIAVLPAQSAVEINWKFEPGDTFAYECITNFKQTLKSPAKVIKTDAKYTSVVEYRVEKKGRSGDIILKQTLKNLAVNDASVDEKLKGSTLTFTLTPRMEVTKVDGFDEMLKKIEGDDPAIRKVVKEVITQNMFKQTTKDALSAYIPDGPIEKVGDTWPGRRSTLPMGPFGELEINNQYKYEGKAKLGDKEYEKITFTSKVSYSPPKKEGTGEKASAYHVSKGKLEAQDGKGTLYFDTASGRLMQLESNLQVHGSFTILHGGSSTEITDFAEEINTTIRPAKESDK